MNLKETKNVIKDTIGGNLDCKSILIDGPWGCGKTTLVKSVIQELKEIDFTKQKIIYQSLYGIKDVAELTACYSYAGKIIYSIGKSITSPFAKLIPIVGEQIKESLDNATGLFCPQPKQKKKTIFIFDDLERTDESLSYISLLGFFNQLIMRGCTIICISSLGDLSLLDKKNKEHLSYFLEKAFDRILHINETPEQIIMDLFKNNENIQKSINKCIGLFNNNIREAIKVNRLLMDIFDNSKKYEYDIEQKFAHVQILKAAICAVKAIYRNNLEEAKENDSNNPNNKMVGIYEEMLSDETNRLNKTVLSNIKNVVNENPTYFLHEEKGDLIELAKCFAYVDTHYDYSQLADLYPSKPKKKQGNFTRQSIFYLGDEDKTTYFEKFKKETLSEKRSFDRQYIDELVEIIKYTDYDLNKDGLLKYIKQAIVQNALSGNRAGLDRLYDYVTFPSEGDSNGLIQQIFSDISKEVHESECADVDKKIKDSLLNEDYAYLIDLIDDINRFKKPEHIREAFKKSLLQNGFFLPNLSKSLTYDQWSYCHQVTKYCYSNQDLKERFLDYLKELTTKYVKSKSAIEKIKALIQYNYGATALDHLIHF